MEEVPKDSTKKIALGSQSRDPHEEIDTLGFRKRYLTFATWSPTSCFIIKIIINNSK